MGAPLGSDKPHHLGIRPLSPQSEATGRAAERLTNLEHTNHAQREMLDAAADRPRSRNDLVDRLRRGGF